MHPLQKSGFRPVTVEEEMDRQGNQAIFAADANHRVEERDMTVGYRMENALPVQTRLEHADTTYYGGAYDVNDSSHFSKTGRIGLEIYEREADWDAVSSIGSIKKDRRPTPNYKPIPFRLWFLGPLVGIILALIVMIGVAVHTLPDGTRAATPKAIINETDLHAREAIPSHLIERGTDEIPRAEAHQGVGTERPENFNTVTMFHGRDNQGSGKEGAKDNNNNNNNSNKGTGSMSVCYQKTVTVTDDDNAIIVATTTVTSYVALQSDIVVGTIMTMPPADSDPLPRLEARACIDGGVRTVTEHIAVPKIVTVTVWETIEGPISSGTWDEPPPSFIPGIFVAVTSTLDIHETVGETALSAQTVNPTPSEDREELPITMLTMITKTLKDENNQPTQTTTMWVHASLTETVLTDSDGRATKTQEYYRLSPPVTTTFILLLPSSTTVLVAYSITEAEYFTGFMLPTLLATLLMIPIRMLDHVAKLYHPFHVMASSLEGARVDRSIYWKAVGLKTFVTRFQGISRGQILLTFTGALMLVSVALVPLSAEALRIILQGEECHSGQGNASNCAITMGVFPVPAQIAMGLLGIMAVLSIAVVTILWRHKTGVEAKPWNLSEMAKLSSHPDMQFLLSQLPQDRGRISEKEAMRVLRSSSYVLDYWHEGSESGYGVVPVAPMPYSMEERRRTFNPTLSGGEASGKKVMPFSVLTTWGRMVLLTTLLGILAIIISYYMLGSKSSLNRFLSSETLGVRLALMSPYQMMYTDRKRVRQAVNMHVPTNAFSGIFHALTPSSRNFYLAAVAFTAILSEFLPALLSNVPYKVIQTRTSHMVCIWASVAILSIMCILVTASFFISWPHMPVDPSAVVGSMYYVSQVNGDAQQQAMSGAGEESLANEAGGYEAPYTPR
ncbi:hypothetical protein B0I35DRAFT_461586 [Stachybotrys elegans]|uniref:Uncharacterized protein n=1 Tax=Stachybotrys elegans TaxID=80388 RepID=A0A8K0SL37_9HYPO|nr:hypothetical protein B0I35DRAFT_461586 [Stachybotrys elegans]